MELGHFAKIQELVLETWWFGAFKKIMTYLQYSVGATFDWQPMKRMWAWWLLYTDGHSTHTCCKSWHSGHQQISS